MAEETTNTGNDYYDDSDEEKDRRLSTDKLYSSTCNVGQFFLNPCLCLFSLLTKNCSRQHVIRIWSSRLKPTHAIFLIPMWGLLRNCLPTSYTGVRPHPLRPRTDAQVNKLPILIHALDPSHEQQDLGGWLLSPIPFRRTVPIPRDTHLMADVGSLHIRALTIEHFEREIDPEDDEKYNDLRMRELNRMNLEPTVAKYDHDDEADYTQCRPPNWKNLYFPTCNSFHEIDLTWSYDRDVISKLDRNYDSYIFSEGFYRDAWLVENVEHKEATVLKVLRFKHDFTPKSFSNVQRDAIVMERLSFSPYIVKMFGHCATSLTVEPIAFEIEEYLVVRSKMFLSAHVNTCYWSTNFCGSTQPGAGYMKQEDLDDKDDVQPQNDYTPMEKLKYGLAMAESLAVLHSYVGGLIVHDDVQLCQWLRTRDGRLVLGDFNRAQIMDWNEQTGEYCPYNNGFAYGNVRDG